METSMAKITVQRRKWEDTKKLLGLPVAPAGYWDDGEVDVPEWGDFSWLREQVDKKADTEWVQREKADHDGWVSQLQERLNRGEQALRGKADKAQLEDIMRLVEAGGHLEGVVRKITDEHLERVDTRVEGVRNEVASFREVAQKASAEQAIAVRQSAEAAERADTACGHADAAAGRCASGENSVKQAVREAQAWWEGEKREVALCRKAAESARDDTQKRGREIAEGLAAVAAECRAAVSVAVEKAQQEAARAARASDEASRSAEAAREPQRQAEATGRVVEAARSLAAEASACAQRAEGSATQGTTEAQAARRQVAEVRDTQEQSRREIAQLTAQLLDSKQRLDEMQGALPFSGGLVARLKWLFAGPARQAK
jgi:hypothetical protein